MTTEIAQIQLAMEGKVDFVKKTNPFGSEDEENFADIPANPELAQKQLIAFFTRREEVRRSGGNVKRND